jgi:hypothetical protein
MPRTIPFLTILAICALPLVGHAQKVPAECQPLIDARRKQLTTPYHGYSIENGGKGRSTEVISVEGAMYVLYQGTWKKSPMGPKDLLEQFETNLKTATTYTCQHLPDESVGGAPATVYRTHMENEGTKADAETWIAKATGLIIKQEEDIDVGDGDKRHHSVRYEYTNVRAPAGAK